LDLPILVSNGYNDGEISGSQNGADEDSSLLGYNTMSTNKLLLILEQCAAYTILAPLTNYQSTWLQNSQY